MSSPNALQVRGLDLASVFQAAAQMQQVKQMREAHRFDRDMRVKEFDQRERANQAKREADAAEAERTSLASKQRYYSDLIKAQPQNADRIAQAARGQGVDVGTIVTPETMQQARRADVEIVDAVSADQAATDLGGRAAGVLGAPDPTKADRPPTTNDITNYNEASRNPEFAAWLKEQDAQRLARAKAAGGDKTLPVSAATDIADAQTSNAVLDNLLAAFQQSVPAGGTGDQIGARVSSYIPNTDVANYGKQADVAAQVVGSFLEGGKLAEGDYARYRSFMPQPGDSSATARRKVAAIKDMIAKRSSGRTQTLGGAGYRTPAAPPPQPSGPDRQAALARLNQLGAAFKQANPGATDEQAKAAAIEAFRAEQGAQ